MTILVDIDGVIFNTQEHLLDWLNVMFNTYYTLSDVTSYDWFDKTFENPWTVTEKPEFWYGVKTNQEAVKYISKWICQGHYVKFVTASHYTQGLYNKLRKLKHDFNWIVYDKDIIVSHDKSLIQGCVLIDDNIENVTEFEGPYFVIYSQPWNDKDVYNSSRSNNWEEIDSNISNWADKSEEYFEFILKDEDEEED